jgi:hypothetical protein
MRPDRLAAGQGTALLAERSALLGVVAIGAGTPLAEGATSRLIRTAWRNRVSVGRALREVAAHVLASVHADERRLPSRWLEYFTGRASVDLLGTGRAAATLIDAWAELTRRTDWRAQTLIDLAAVVPPHGLLEPRRRWCPVCLAGFPEPYEPLLWQIAPLTICQIHRTLLETACPDPGCGAERWALAAAATVGFCACGAPLAQALPREASFEGPELEWHVWVGRELGALVAALASLDGPVSGGHLGPAVDLAVSRTAPTYTAFARAVGVSLSTVSVWKDGHRQIPIELALRVCRVAGFRLADFLLGDLEALRSAPVPEAAWLPPRHRPYVRRDIGPALAELREAATDGPPSSVDAIARRHGMDGSYLRRHAPDLCRSASARWKELRDAEHAARIERYAASVVRAVDEIHAEGVYPSMQRVRARVEAPVTWDVLMVAWRRRLVELGYIPGGGDR